MQFCSRAIWVAAGLLYCCSSQAEAQISPIVTAKTEFRIPFTFDDGEVDRRGITEVQLFVSRDDGQTWTHARSTLPTGKKFRYRVTEDGQYAFAVRTLDRERNLHPSGPLKPGLIVRVDATKPVVQLTTSQALGGRATVAWACHDADLNPSTLLLEYKPEGGNAWLKLPCKATASGSIELPSKVRSADVRVLVRDGAGNLGTAQSTWRATQILPAAASSFSEPNGLLVPSPVQPNDLANAAVFEPPRAAALPQVVSLPKSPDVPVIAAAMQRDVVGPFELPTAKPPKAGPSPRSALSVPASGLEQELDASLPQVINKLQFSLDYGLEGVGSSGLSSVNVYITEDGGKKWWRYGSDRDKRSPVVLQVPRDGEYGFVISAKSGAGLGEPPPSSGDTPQAVVIVDRAPPRARFDSIQLTADGHQLDVRWTAEDPNMHETPIRLEYSRTQSGPWKPMDDWQANSGHYEWSVMPQVPSRIYVRMVARDAAGNAGQLVYPQSILVDVSKPRARINSIKVSTR